MSSPEHREIIERQTLKPYVTGGVELVEVTLNKGRIPKAPRTLTNRQRREMKNQALNRGEVVPLMNEVTDTELPGETAVAMEPNMAVGLDYEGMLFTFKPV